MTGPDRPHGGPTSYDMVGRTALITGANTGLGRAIAEAFGASGTAVVVSYLDDSTSAETVAHAITATGGSAMCVRTDVREAEQVAACFAAARRAFGRVDILVNCAGIFHLGSLIDMAEREWDTMIDTNLKSVFLCCREALPEMVERGRGTIINIASTASLVASRNRPAYCASKGGVVLLTRALAGDYAGSSISVNAICPGLIDTSMATHIVDDRNAYTSFMARTPAGYIGTPADIAHAALYLASDGARYVHGHCLVVDCGLCAVVD